MKTFNEFLKEEIASLCDEDSMAMLIQRNMERRAKQGLTDIPISQSKIMNQIDAIGKDDDARSRSQASSIVHKYGLGIINKKIKKDTKDDNETKNS